VWNAKERPMQRMAPMKNAEKIALSGQEITSDGWQRNQMKIPRNAMLPKYILFKI
jgi:hypothetical protein